MKIEYLNKPAANFTEIKNLLSISETQNQYTNNGPVKKLLEDKLHKTLNLNNDKKVVCVCNGTAAIQAIMFLCKKNKLNKWVIPAYTFPSAIVGNIFDVTIKDISLDSYTLDLEKIKEFDGVIITNLFGTYSNLNETVDFCKTNNIKLIYDNAASPLSTYNGINICNFGDYCIGSLHHTKYLGYGEGGFIVCNEKEYDIINSLSNFGYPDYITNMEFSSNFKMSDITAAFILAHIDSFDNGKYLEIQNKLIRKIGIENIFNYNKEVVYNSLPVLFDKPVQAQQYKNIGIEANKYYQPLSNTAENSIYLYERIINLPLHPYLSNKDIEYISKQTLVIKNGQ